MTRITCVFAATTFALAACASVTFGATRSETTTYVDGNLMGVAPNTGGTLVFSDDKAMVLHTGLTSVSVPYASISKAELGVTKSHSHDAPKIEVWKHIGHKSQTQTQYLVVNFKNETGQDKSMTLELAHAAAPEVLETINSHLSPAQSAAVAEAAQPQSKKASKPITPAVQAKSAKNSNDWWGDDYWKTPRNSDKWGKAAPTTAAGAPEPER